MCAGEVRVLNVHRVGPVPGGTSDEDDRQGTGSETVGRGVGGGGVGGGGDDDDDDRGDDVDDNEASRARRPIHADGRRRVLRPAVLLLRE